MTTEPLRLEISLDLGEAASPEELDGAARNLRRELLDAGLDDVELAAGPPPPEGVKSAEALIAGALSLTLLPSLLAPLLAVAQDWTRRRPGRALKLAYSIGDQRFDLEYDPDKLDVNDLLSRLMQAQPAANAPGLPPGAHIGGDMVSGDKVSHVSAEGDAVGRDKVTHIHAAPGSTIIVQDSPPKP
jgi:hypothetical protein